MGNRPSTSNPLRFITDQSALIAAPRYISGASRFSYSVAHLRRLTHILDTRTARVEGAALPVLEEDQGGVHGSDEPQEHVCKVHPDSILHADLSTLLRRGFRANVDVAEDAKERGPENE